VVYVGSLKLHVSLCLLLGVSANLTSMEHGLEMINGSLSETWTLMLAT